ncbi:uracil-DNA glycosylase family protein [Rhizohabitans arisaemae]|uniref:uracil-DNA glycosylase family protein n=1 Tax=Rhizohabitans arisaemae TaxID=2720610 RepID=UPI0024B0F59C|nr:uracil-DNA glycosylase family protein [Rhizohabitans arisaemae]
MRTTHPAIKTQAILLQVRAIPTIVRQASPHNCGIVGHVCHSKPSDHHETRANASLKSEHICYIAASAGGRISPAWCSLTFEDKLRKISPDITEKQITTPELLLYEDHKLEIYFVPFDWVNVSARVMLVGLTPGRHQMHLALKTTARALQSGKTLNEALKEADEVGSFAGSMRTNMISMLDGIGLDGVLGLNSTAQLFDDRTDLLASTSAICHAVFIKGANYSGSPQVDRHPVLEAFARQVLNKNLEMVPDALVIPLGKGAREAVELTTVLPDRILYGFPHPSGANGHRARQYNAMRDQMTQRVRTWARTF